MMMIPIDRGERKLAVDWYLDDVTGGRMSREDARELLAQLRLAGDLAALERIARAVDTHRLR